MQRLQNITGHLVAGPAAEAKLVATPTSYTKKPVKVLVTGAAGNIAYSIIFMIGQGAMLGLDQPVDLHLLDIPPMADAMKGVVMELQDCAYPLINSIVATTDAKTAFSGVEVALLVGAKPRGPGMQRKDLLSANAAIFKAQGKALDQFAARNVKVLVVGNPANTNALIAMKNAPSLPKGNFHAMTRLDENRAKSLLAERLKVPVVDVKNVTIWGNHSKTQYPEVNHAYVVVNGRKVPVRAAVKDDEWLNSKFLSTVQDRGAAIIQVRKKSSAASAASSAVDHVRDWFLGTRDGEWTSMAIYSDGSLYGVPKDIIYSFPCTVKNGKVEVVQGMKIDAFSRQKMEDTAKELIEERTDAGY